MKDSAKKIISQRKSVRTFDGRRLEQQDLDRLAEYIKSIENPFQVPVTLRVLDGKEQKLSSPVVVGTDLYVGGKVKRMPRAEEALGYSFEKFVLFATAMGVGTVWLAATIDRPAFEKAMEVGKDEVMPVVSPIGYAAEKRSMREKLMRKGLNADERLPFEELFYKTDFSQPLKKGGAGKFEEPLEMVRIAPSATNKQPWRVVLDGEKVHFYEKKTKGYAKETTGDIQKVDLGIALCHFELSAGENGIAGVFVDQNPHIDHEDDMEYILSYEASA